MRALFLVAILSCCAAAAPRNRAAKPKASLAAKEKPRVAPSADVASFAAGAVLVEWVPPQPEMARSTCVSALYQGAAVLKMHLEWGVARVSGEIRPGASTMCYDFTKMQGPDVPVRLVMESAGTGRLRLDLLSDYKDP